MNLTLFSVLTFISTWFCVVIPVYYLAWAWLADPLSQVRKKHTNLIVEMSYGYGEVIYCTISGFGAAWLSRAMCYIPDPTLSAILSLIAFPVSVGLPCLLLRQIDLDLERLP